jgi:hypothetical protein
MASWYVFDSDVDDTEHAEATSLALKTSPLLLAKVCVLAVVVATAMLRVVYRAVEAITAGLLPVIP